MVDAGEIKKYWIKLSDKVNALTLRERVILLAMVNTILVVSVIFFFLDPLFIDITHLRKSVGEVTNETLVLKSEYTETKVKYSIDPNEQTRHRLIGIEGKLRRKDGLIKSKSSQLIPANIMVDLLKDLLLKQKKIELISFSNIKPEPVSWDSKSVHAEEEVQIEEEVDNGNLSDEKKILAALMQSMTESGGDKKENKGIPKYTDFLLYRHGVVMQLKGEYREIVNYLQDIERLEWKFYWHHVDYEVTEYPKATVTLELQTLGYEEGWLGA